MAIRNRAFITAVVVWLAQVLTCAPAVEAVVHDSSRPVQVAITTLGWLVWAVGLVALLIPSTISCTVVRVVAPLPMVAVAVAIASDTSGLVIGVAAAGSVAAFGLLNSAEVGRVLVQGSAYGDEARFLLRPPTLLVVTMVPLVWIVSVGPALGAVALVAARQWVAGVALALVAAITSWFGIQRLHRLSRRWLVMVPAGVVIHDQFALAETAMFRRQTVRSIEPAEVGTSGLDLTAGAAGLVVEIVLQGAQPVVPRPSPGQPANAVSVSSVLICPSQPGRLIGEMARRAQHRLPT